MSSWTDAMIRTALGLSAGRVNVTYPSISTDSRSIEQGALFIALKGERFDAHDYLVEVANKGARGAVIHRLPPDAPDNLILYRVDDTLSALGKLGTYHRRKLGAKLCAVTGSNGKTTTKEILRAMLSTRFNVHATSGNFNNLIGTPLTLLAAPADTEVIVAELGTSVPGEVARLAEIVEADTAVVTAISEEHLEGLGDLRGVLEEETALLPSLPSDGLAIVADEPPELAAAARAKASRVAVAGWSERADADLRAQHVDLDENGNVKFMWRGREVALPLRGRHNARNALIALGIALHYGVMPDEAIAALAELKPAKMRGEVHEYSNGMKVIVDCYNSNPASLSAAIDLLASMPHNGPRVAIVGSMLELGAESAALHAKAAQEIEARDFDTIVATGAFVPAFTPLESQLGDRLIMSEDPVAGFERLADRLTGNELILLKGSRGVALERLLPRFETMGMPHPHGEAGRPGARSPRTDMSDDAQSAGHFQFFQAEENRRGEGKD